jgi:hypothetical protein
LWSGPERKRQLPFGPLSLLTLLQTHVKPVSNGSMVLSNAERQARYRQRLKEAAAQGVTPELIVKTLKEEWERDLADDPDRLSWDEYVERCRRSPRGRALWVSNVRGLLRLRVYEDADLGGDPETLRKVLAVIAAVVEPPERT